MSGFIEHIVNAIPDSAIAELKDHCYVFPTRRAVFHFKDELKKRFRDQPFWAPEVFSINDFILHCTKGGGTDDLRLIYELFEVHRELYSSDLKFETFYPWGSMLLRDFDELDKYLVDTKSLYTFIANYKDIEEMFKDDADIVAAVSKFRTSVEKRDESNIQSNFVAVWDTLNEIHLAFRDRLAKKGFGYDGMYYRALSDGLNDGTITLPFTKVCFAGFNALSKAEESIIDALLEKDQGEIYWDSDKYYLKDKFQEAGKFNREYEKKWENHPNSHWVVTDSFQAKDKFNFIGTVESVGQAKIAHEIVQSKIEAGTLNPEKTGIILCAENLLFPVLNALPQDINKVNITMGYPLKYTALYGFTEVLIDLQKQAASQDGASFSRKALQRISTNSLVSSLFPTETHLLRNLTTEMKTGAIPFADIKKTIGKSALLSLFEVKKSHEALLDWLVELYTNFFYRQK